MLSPKALETHSSHNVNMYIVLVIWNEAWFGESISVETKVILGSFSVEFKVQILSNNNRQKRKGLCFVGTTEPH